MNIYSVFYAREYLFRQNCLGCSRERFENMKFMRNARQQCFYRLGPRAHLPVPNLFHVVEIGRS